MKTNLKYLGVAAVALIGGLMAAPAAQAQSVVVADFDAAMLKTKAFTVANASIQATYKTQIAQADQIKKELQPLLAPFDLNKDGQVDDNEQAAAQSNPTWATVIQKQNAINTAMSPVILAQLYAMSQIEPKLNAAAQTVVNTRGITLILRPGAIQWANQVGDVTPGITAELDKLVPAVSTTPPAGWKPGAAPAAAPAPGAAPAPAPAAPGKKPAGR